MTVNKGVGADANSLFARPIFSFDIVQNLVKF
jgi:hypothetical protein